jgi:tRNA uridine 5-carboxymethylaminomethyl modification enzyme
MGIATGCVRSERAQAFAIKHGALQRAHQLIRSLALTPPELAKRGLSANQDGIIRTAFELLGRPGMSISRLAQIWPELNGLAPDIAEQLEIEARYRGYLDRQEADIRAFRRDETLALPASLDYDTVGSLSAEVCQKLKAARPATLGAAGRIAGVTPAALVALLRHVRKAAARQRSAA